jgi:hypothetical protein
MHPTPVVLVADMSETAAELAEPEEPHLEIVLAAAAVLVAMLEMVALAPATALLLPERALAGAAAVVAVSVTIVPPARRLLAAA